MTWQLTIAILVKFIFIPQNSKSELETTLWHNKAKPFLKLQAKFITRHKLKKNEMQAH